MKEIMSECKILSFSLVPNQWQNLINDPKKKSIQFNLMIAPTFNDHAISKHINDYFNVHHMFNLNGWSGH